MSQATNSNQVDESKYGGPTCRVLRMRDLCLRVGYRPSTIYQLIQARKFPPSFKLIPGGRASGWLDSTIDAWLKGRAASAQQD